MCLGCFRTLTVILVADLLRHLNPPQCFSSHITSHDLNLLDRIPTSVYRLTLFHITSITLLHLPSPLCSSSYITSPHPIQCHLTTPHCISSHRSLHIASHVPYFIYPTSLHFGWHLASLHFFIFFLTSPHSISSRPLILDSANRLVPFMFSAVDKEDGVLGQALSHSPSPYGLTLTWLGSSTSSCWSVDISTHSMSQLLGLTKVYLHWCNYGKLKSLYEH